MIQRKNLKKIDISVIITAYNAEDTIIDTLNSVNWKYHNFNHEIVVADDGSIDSTLDLIENFPSVVPFRIIKLVENMGRPCGLNAAIKSSTGRYIAILDSDDLNTQVRLPNSFNYLEQNMEVDLVAGQYIKFGDWGYSQEPSKLPTDLEKIRKKFLQGQNPVAHSSAMYRLDWIAKQNFYEEKLNVCPDYDLFLRGFTGNNYRIFDEVFYYYRTANIFPSKKYFLENEVYRKSINQRFYKSIPLAVAIRNNRKKRQIFTSTLKYVSLKILSKLGVK